MKNCQIFLLAGAVSLFAFSGCGQSREAFSDSFHAASSREGSYSCCSQSCSQTANPPDSPTSAYESSQTAPDFVQTPSFSQPAESSAPVVSPFPNSAFASSSSDVSASDSSASTSTAFGSHALGSTAQSSSRKRPAESSSPPTVPKTSPQPQSSPPQTECAHDYIPTSDIPSCESGGTVSYRCTKCGKTYSENIPAKNHDFVETITVKATDYSMGVKKFSCKNCGESYTEKYALGHTISLGNSKTAVVYGYWDKNVSDEIFALLNEYRRENGLCELKFDEKLFETAKLRALECAYLLSHTRPNGQRCFTAFPKNYALAGENVGGGFKGNAQKVMTAWKNSALHNANLLEPEFKYVGTSLFVLTGYDPQNHAGTYFAQAFISY